MSLFQWFEVLLNNKIGNNYEKFVVAFNLYLFYKIFISISYINVKKHSNLAFCWFKLGELKYLDFESYGKAIIDLR